jgi:multicomponent Na+:H+ antiporter subunit G
MSWISTAIVVVLLSAGGLFCLLAAVGLLVMSDVYNRMQAASKAVTLGAACTVLAAATHFGEGDITTRCLLVCLFFVVTVPVASHLIARAAHRSNEPLAAETVTDELTLAEQRGAPSSTTTCPPSQAPPQEPPESDSGPVE